MTPEDLLDQGSQEPVPVLPPARAGRGWRCPHLHDPEHQVLSLELKGQDPCPPSALTSPALLCTSGPAFRPLQCPLPGPARACVSASQLPGTFLPPVQPPISRTPS